MIPAVGVQPITDPADERLAPYRDLRDGVAPGGAPGAGGLFVAEGTHAVRRLLASPYRTVSVLVTPARLDALAGALAGRDLPVLVADRPVMAAVAGFDVHRGVLAAGLRPPPLAAGDLLPAAGRLAVLEGINDHENLGVLFRNAAALWVDAVLLSPTCCDPLYRRSVRVSMGHVLTTPFARLEPWPAGLRRLGTAGFTVVALTPGAGAEPIHRLAVDPACRYAVLVGAEGPGLTAGALAGADRCVRIPMAPGVDSLNVAAAAAVAFHHLAPRH